MELRHGCYQKHEDSLQSGEEHDQEGYAYGDYHRLVHRHQNHQLSRWIQDVSQKL